MTPWWTDQQAAMFGGILGGALGGLGGLMGTIAGICAPRGKCKALVYSLHFFLVAVGVIALGAGIVALLVHQHWAVYYPLLLIGFILTAVAGSLIPVIHQRYRQAERRRLEAEEFRRG